LPVGPWMAVLHGREVNLEGIEGGRSDWSYVAARSALILVK
jgi:hypothetical protein